MTKQAIAKLTLLLVAAVPVFEACGSSHGNPKPSGNGGEGGDADNASAGIPAGGKTGGSSSGAQSGSGGSPGGVAGEGTAGAVEGGTPNGGASEVVGGAAGESVGGHGAESGAESGAGGCDGAAGADCGSEPPGLKAGSSDVISREGFSAQCREWRGSICTKPWIQIPESSVVVPGANALCLDDTTSLRPVWYSSEGVEEAMTFCWVATGSSQYQAMSTDGPSSKECGWMYGTFTSNDDETPACSSFRRYSEVDSPEVVANIIWSFDQLSECRVGTFSTFECNWSP